LKGWTSGLYVILVNFIAPGSGSVFPIWIRILAVFPGDPDEHRFAGSRTRSE